MANFPEKCFLTGVNISPVQSGRDAIEYEIKIDGKVYLMSFHWDHRNSSFVNENRHVITSLLINKKWKPSNEIMDNEFLENLIRLSYYPKSPKDKLDNLLITIHGRQKYEGCKIDLSHDDEKRLVTQCYMKNWDEVLFYLNTMKESNLIKFSGTHTKEGYSLGSIYFTYNGLEYIISLQEDGQFSKNCFVAMSFSKNVTEIRKTIKQAVIDAGYNPILIDEIDYDSDITINDAMINHIKKSKFLIADFTEQRHGVYFEAGYALGLKRPVIYACSEKDFKESHFDTNHYPHIVYSELEDLASNLKDKIGAWID